MSNGLFIRDYPARGIKVIPTSYSAGANGYFLFLFVPIYALLFFVVFFCIGFRQRWVFGGLFASVVLILLALSLLRRFSLEISVDGISYTSPIRAAQFVAFSEISTVVLIDYRHSRSEAQPRRTPLSWTAIIMPNIETGKPAMKIPLSFFPGAAYREMTRLLQPEVWESGT